MRKLIGMVGLLLLTSANSAFAVSEAVTPWLLFSMGARGSGMGGAQATEATGADAVYWNPANLAFLEGRSITGMHFSPVPDLTDDVYFEYASYAQQTENFGGIGGNIMFLTYGESVATDETGIRLREFTSWEMALGGGWGTKIAENVAAGVGAKLVLSYLSPEIGELEEGQGVTWALDFGIHARRLFAGMTEGAFFPNGFRVGVAVMNLGPALKFVDNGSPNPLPLNFRLGIGLDAYVDESHRVTFAADMNKVLVKQSGGTGTEEFTVDPAWKSLFTAWTDDPFGEELEEAIYNIGIEYALREMVFLRTGWVQDSTGDITDYTLGVGLEWQKIQFDFANYPQAEGLDTVKRFSITYNF